MTHPHLNAVHRQTILRKLEALNPAPATNQAPRPSARPADPMRALRAAGDSLARRLGEAKAMLQNLKTSPTPAATLRKVETLTRKTAAELSAARRSAPAAAPAPEPAAPAPAPAPAPQPAAPAAPEPLLAQFERLEGPAASALYAEHGRAIRAEAAARQHDKRKLDHEMQVARAASKNLAHLNKR
jgi:hypothetical protein